MPEGLEYPETMMVDEDGEEYLDPLTFICQIRCEDIAALDPDGLLPHEGMLYFFAALDYFLGDIYNCDSPGLGLWQQKHYRVLYSPHCDDLHTHRIVYDDGSPVGLPAEAISFSLCSENDDSNRLLGLPWLEEVREEMPDMISLLQINEEDRWRLRFYDCGVLNFLITPQQLRLRQWDKVQCHLFSF